MRYLAFVGFKINNFDLCLKYAKNTYDKVMLGPKLSVVFSLIPLFHCSTYEFVWHMDHVLLGDNSYR